MMDFDVMAAIRELEAIINRQWNEICISDRQRYSRYRFFPLRKDMAQWRLHTQNQLLLDVGYGCIAKTNSAPLLKHDDYYFIDASSYSVASSVFPEKLAELGIDCPMHHYVGAMISPEHITISEKGLTFAIVPDLTYGGRYVVEDIRDAHFSGLGNGKELKEELDGYICFFSQMVHNPDSRYDLDVDRHIHTESGIPAEGIRHMFFVQIDPSKNTGKLIAGDLDHIAFTQKYSYHSSGASH